MCPYTHMIDKFVLTWLPRYLLNIAATDFPLKTNDETVAYLRSLNGRSDIEDAYNPIEWRYKYSFRNETSFIIIGVTTCNLLRTLYFSGACGV